MKTSTTAQTFLVFFSSFVLVPIGFAQQPSAAAPAKESGFNASILWGPRDISGDVYVSRNPALSGKATADSLGLDPAYSFQYQVGYRHKRWMFAFDVMPTSYSGQGFAEIDIDLGIGPGISINTPITSNIDVEMYLMNVLWEAWVGDTWEFSIGFGLGQTAIDVELIPDIGNGISYDGKTPFGYLALQYAKRWGPWSINAGIQDVSLSSGSNEIDFSNLNLMGGYLFHDENFKLQAVAGYRRVGFLFDYSDDAAGIRTDLVLEGPYIGIAGSF